MDEEYLSLMANDIGILFPFQKEENLSDVKGYRLLQPHSHDIIIRRDIKFDENLLAYDPNLVDVPSLACKPNSAIVPSSSSSSSSSSNFPNRFPNPVSDDDNEDENPPLPTHVALVTPA